MAQPLHSDATILPWSREDLCRGIANTRERRKIQNRINQRARRTRRRAEAQASTDDPNHASVIQLNQALAIRAIPLLQLLDVENMWDAIQTHDPKSWEAEPRVRAFKDFIYNNWLASAPLPALLPHLVQFNFVRALMANAGALGLTAGHLEEDAISPFCVTGPRLPTDHVDSTVGSLPNGLKPTDLQRRTVHNPWYDLFPIPRMRDNLLSRELNDEHQDELCCTMGGFGDVKDAGFLIWGNSWECSNWEVTEDFVRSPWRWVIEECWELCESTNRWRAQRGEPPLFFSQAKVVALNKTDKNI
ncbi:hypothetical protein F4678DRAFT_452911 [Xylaria arbuscula]|nr:hypothetical protein F4678DRAFT_452911 [Xylaria arbuscula]